MVADAGDVGLIVVAADMRDMGDAVTSLEDLVETAVLIQVSAVKRQAPGRITRHGAQEAGARQIVGVPDAGPHAIAFIQQLSHHPAAEKSRCAGDRDQAALGDG